MHYVIAGVISLGGFIAVLWAMYKLGGLKEQLKEEQESNEKAVEIIIDMAEHLEEKDELIRETEERLIEELVASGDVESVVDAFNELLQDKDSPGKLPN